jgi:hypothetical protein
MTTRPAVREFWRALLVAQRIGQVVTEDRVTRHEQGLVRVACLR